MLVDVLKSAYRWGVLSVRSEVKSTKDPDQIRSRPPYIHCPSANSSSFFAPFAPMAAAAKDRSSSIA